MNHLLVFQIYVFIIIPGSVPIRSDIVALAFSFFSFFFLLFNIYV